MRPSPSAHGIKGIFALIRAHAPDAVTDLSAPSSSGWHALAGRRVAVDGTLLLTRLHFSSSASPHRHLLGLSAFLATLRTHRIRPLLVFDNPLPTARLPQKAREHARRRAARARILQRAEAERRRQARLTQLQLALDRLAAMEADERAECARWLRRWDVPLEQASASDPPSLSLLDELLAPEPRSGLPRLPEEEDVTLSPALLDELRSSLPLGRHIDDVLDAERQSSGARASLLSPVPIRTTSAPSAESGAAWDEILEAQTSPALALAAQIAHLRASYSAHSGESDAAAAAGAAGTERDAETPRQALLSQQEAQVYAALLAGQEARALVKIVEETQTETARESEEVEVAKTQAAEAQRIADAEEEPNCAASVATGDAAAPLEALAEAAAPAELLSSLSVSQAQLRASYERSSAKLPPSVVPFAAELCALHHIPVLYTGSGARNALRAHEAEALCARVVRDGYADAVVSEDSDTLLFDVPLIRGALGGKLQVVDGRKVRHAFFPPESMPLPVAAAAAASTSSTAVKQTGASVPELALDAAAAESEDILDDEATPSSADENAGDVSASLDASSTAAAQADAESWERMLELALLCGTDFNRTVPGIAGRTALKLIREHGRISAVLRASSAAAASASASARRSAAASAATPAMRKYAPPASLTWRAYSKELNAARGVFRRMPSLQYVAHRLRAWAASDGADDSRVSAEALNVFWRNLLGPRAEEPEQLRLDDSEELALEDTPARKERKSKATPGFGSALFEDAPTHAAGVASWDPSALNDRQSDRHADGTSA